MTQRCAPSCSCIDAYVVVYCIDDRSSFDRAVDVLYNLRKEEHSDSAIILVANKCELARSRLVTTEGMCLAYHNENFVLIEINVASYPSLLP